MRAFDVLILGAGAAGMMAAIEAGKRGRRVLLVDHAKAAGEKIRISGGGRCNFTNRQTHPSRFLSENPRFAISPLSRYTAADFIALADRHKVPYHEKTLGQLFCDDTSLRIVNLLHEEMRRANVTLETSTEVIGLRKDVTGFAADLSSGAVAAQSVVVATGGKSIPKMGATGLGYRLAEQFGLAVTATRPGLVPLTFEPTMLEKLAPLAGVSTEAVVSRDKQKFREALLFTHRGLSGPAILQISSFWREGDAITIDLLPDTDVLALFQAARATTPKLALQTVLAQALPKRLAQLMGEEIGQDGRVGDLSDAKLRRAAETVKAWTIKPVSSEGYRTAEVTLGGVSTSGLDGKTMMARAVPGLYFIGEVVDVTGWLGGYNFQWAWSSGWVAGQAA